MNTDTCTFVKRSDVFAGCDNLWESVCAGSTDFAWGNNRRTLIYRDDVIEMIENSEPGEPSQKVIVLNRLRQIGEMVYIDLEN